MGPEVLVGDADRIRDALVHDFHAEATRALTARAIFSVALPGGSVAENTFSALSSLELDWHRLHFFWADERAVDPADPESNYGAAQRTWLEPARIPAHAIHRMKADSVDLDKAAAS